MRPARERLALRGQGRPRHHGCLKLFDCFRGNENRTAFANALPGSRLTLAPRRNSDKLKD